MNFGPEIVVLVSSSSVPVKFRAEDSPTWGIILQQLSVEHGPGVLKDGQGFNKLLNPASMDQAVPLGTYEYITQSAAGKFFTHSHRCICQWTEPGVFHTEAVSDHKSS